MLVLTRRVGEEIVIDGCIHVSIVAIQGNRVRLAIRAPESVAVDRSEIHERRQGFKESAPRPEGRPPKGGDQPGGTPAFSSAAVRG
jgi:carbon storage regulator